MKQLMFIKAGQLRWEEAAEPTLSEPDGALVRPFLAARCDLDAIFLRRNLPRLLGVGKALGLVDPAIDRLAGPGFLRPPFPFGHECLAEVLEVGPEVAGFRRGDRVIVPFQISCGLCGRCRGGLTSQCEDSGAFDMYGGLGRHARGGVMSDVLYVPKARAMLVPLPPDIDPLVLASAADNLPDAWSRVAPELLENPGRRVLVIAGSARSIGLYCVAFAAAMKARVDVLGCEPEDRTLAELLGGRIIEGAGEERYELVVNAGHEPAAIPQAIRALKPGGVLSSASIYFNRSVKVPFFQLYAKNLTLKTGLANPLADLPAMLTFIAEKRPPLDRVTTRLAAWDEAPAAFLESAAKVVVRRAPLEAGS